MKVRILLETLPTIRKATYMLVYSKERKNGFAPDEVRRMNISHKTSIFADDTKVSMISSQQSTGLNKNGKRYFRWNTSEVQGFRRQANGGIVPFHRIKKQGQGFKNVVPMNPFDLVTWGNDQDRVNAYDESIRRFITEVEDHFGLTHFTDVYPIAGMYELPRYIRMPYGLRTSMRGNDFKEYVAKTFGKNNMRKDLVKAVAGADITLVNYAKEFRNDVPIDWIINFLRTNSEYVTTDTTAFGHIHNRLNKVVARMDQRTLRNLMNATIDTNEIYNVGAMFPNMRINQMTPVDNADLSERFRNWHDIHNHVYQIRNLQRRDVRGLRAYNRYVPPVPVNEEIPVHDKWKNYHNIIAGDMTIRLAKDTDEMRAWSSEMHNCISSYAHYAVTGYGCYLGVFKEEKLIANVEIDGNNTLKQLLGKYNQSLDADTSNTVTSALQEAGKTKVPEHYWGSPAGRLAPAEIVAEDYPERIVEHNPPIFNPAGVDNALLDW